MKFLKVKYNLTIFNLWITDCSPLSPLCFSYIVSSYKETEDMIRIAGKMTSHSIAIKGPSGLRLKPFFCERFKYRRE